MLETLVIVWNANNFLSWPKSEHSRLWGLQGNGGPEQCKQTTVTGREQGNKNRRERGTHEPGFTYIQCLLKFGLILWKKPIS